jgi:hypothetical protein
MKDIDTFEVCVLFFFKDDPEHRWVHTIGLQGIPSKEAIEDMKSEVSTILTVDGYGVTEPEELDFCLVPKDSMDVFYEMMNKTLKEIEKITKEKDGTNVHNE